MALLVLVCAFAELINAVLLTKKGDFNRVYLSTMIYFYLSCILLYTFAYIDDINRNLIFNSLGLGTITSFNFGSLISQKSEIAIENALMKEEDLKSLYKIKNINYYTNLIKNMQIVLWFPLIYLGLVIQISYSKILPRLNVIQELTFYYIIIMLIYVHLFYLSLNFNEIDVKKLIDLSSKKLKYYGKPNEEMKDMLLKFYILFCRYVLDSFGIYESINLNDFFKNFYLSYYIEDSNMKQGYIQKTYKLERLRSWRHRFLDSIRLKENTQIDPYKVLKQLSLVNEEKWINKTINVDLIFGEVKRRIEVPSLLRSSLKTILIEIILFIAISFIIINLISLTLRWI